MTASRTQQPIRTWAWLIAGIIAAAAALPGCAATHDMA